MDKLNLQMFVEQEQTETGKETLHNTKNSTPVEEQNKDKKEPNRVAVKYSDEDVDRIIAKKFAKWQKQSQMNTEKKVQQECKQYEKQFGEMQNKIALNGIKDNARKLFSNNGINVPDSVLEMLVSSDVNKTQSAIKDFIKMFKTAVSNTIINMLKEQITSDC